MVLGAGSHHGACEERALGTFLVGLPCSSAFPRASAVSGCEAGRRELWLELAWPVSCKHSSHGSVWAGGNAHGGHETWHGASVGTEFCKTLLPRREGQISHIDVITVKYSGMSVS